MRRKSRPLALAAAIAGALAGTILTSFAAAALHAQPLRDPSIRSESRLVFKVAAQPVELRDLLARMAIEGKSVQLLTVGASTRDVPIPIWSASRTSSPPSFLRSVNRWLW